MSHEYFVSVDLAKQGSMSSVNIFSFSTPTTSSPALIRNAKKFSTVSCISRIMQQLSTTAFFLPGHHSIKGRMSNKSIWLAPRNWICPPGTFLVIGSILVGYSDSLTDSCSCFEARSDKILELTFKAFVWLLSCCEQEGEGIPRARSALQWSCGHFRVSVILKAHQRM